MFVYKQFPKNQAQFVYNTQSDVFIAPTLNLRTDATSILVLVWNGKQVEFTL